MLHKSFFSGIRQRYMTHDTERRELIKAAGDALHLSKQAIFALHRGDVAEAGVILNKAGALLKSIQKRVNKYPELQEEGSLRASEEEFVEAHIFKAFVEHKNAAVLTGVRIPDNVYLGGLCDVPGELVRFAMREASARRFKEVQRASTAVSEIMAFLISINLTGYLRTKYDQAKGAMKRMEEIVYDIRDDV